MDAIARLVEILGLSEPIRIVDIGANPIDGPAPYAPLLAAGLCTVTGFEPQAEALERLLAHKSDRETYLPYAVGDGGIQKLHLCAYSGWTSTLRPDPRSLDLFQMFKGNAQVTGEVEIATRRLDDIAEVGPIDYLKIDIQGGEPPVFRHGREKLANVLMVQSEISFFPLYEGQPSFGEMDLILRGFGLLPHHFDAMKKCIIAPMEIGGDPFRPLNQLLEADLVYARDLRDHAVIPDEGLRKMAAIAHVCYGSYDLPMNCLLRLRDRGAAAASAIEDYVALVNSAGATA
jgi:FkbM family methyltransferase